MKFRKWALGVGMFAVLATTVAIAAVFTHSSKNVEPSVATSVSPSANGMLGVAVQGSVVPSPVKPVKPKAVDERAEVQRYVALLIDRWEFAIGLEGGLGPLEVGKFPGVCNTPHNLPGQWKLCPVTEEHATTLLYGRSLQTDLRLTLASAGGPPKVVVLMALFYAEHILKPRLEQEDLRLFRDNRPVVPSTVACWAGKALQWFGVPMVDAQATFASWQSYFGKHNPAWGSAATSLTAGYTTTNWKDCLGPTA